MISYYLIEYHSKSGSVDIFLSFFLLGLWYLSADFNSV